MSTYASDGELHDRIDDPDRIDVAHSVYGIDVRLSVGDEDAHLSPTDAVVVARALKRAAQAAMNARWAS